MNMNFPKPDQDRLKEIEAARKQLLEQGKKENGDGAD
jgi:hypothetical protein